MGHFEVDFSGASDRWTTMVGIGGGGGKPPGDGAFSTHSQATKKKGPGSFEGFFLGGMTVTTQFHIGVIIYHYSGIPINIPSSHNHP